jgi:hypothetical protein
LSIRRHFFGLGGDRQLTATCQGLGLATLRRRYGRAELVDRVGAAVEGGSTRSQA